MRKFLFSLIIVFASTVHASDFYFSNFDGPNCINGAMVKAKLLPYQRYSSNSELWDKLHSIQCNRVSLNDLNVGDIGIIIDHGPHSLPNVISHAFVYLDKQTSFEKHGWAKTEAYQTVDTLNILEEYDVRDDGNVRVEYYRCISQASFLKVNNHKINVEIIALYKKISNLEQIHFQISQGNNVDEEKFKFKEFYTSIKNDLLILDQLKLTDIDRLIINDIANRMDSFRLSRLIEFRLSPQSAGI
jgi:hypothetical protein